MSKKNRIMDYKIDKYKPFDKKEIAIAKKIVSSGVLSDFIGRKGKNFLGGYYVRKFEDELQKYFKVKHAITVNSWTSGLIASLGAIGLEPGDEVIMPTWTMSACAMSVIHWNAIPVFVDIEDHTLILIKLIEKNFKKDKSNIGS